MKELNKSAVEEKFREAFSKDSARAENVKRKAIELAKNSILGRISRKLS